MTREEDIWCCSKCGQEQGRHDNWFEDETCGDCNALTLTPMESIVLQDIIQKLREGIKTRNILHNVNGGFCNIDFINCDDHSIFLDYSYGISDGYSREVTKGVMELDREDFEVISTTDTQKITQEYEEEEIVTNLI